MTARTAAALAEQAPVELGVSEWRRLDQRQVDLFAEATGDDQWIHVDVERAAAGPFGTTIAHGYLSLSLVPLLLQDILRLDGERLGVNYGIDRLRFPAPVPVGSEIRVRATVLSGEPRGDGHLLRLGTQVEVRGSEKPALVGELLYFSVAG